MNSLKLCEKCKLCNHLTKPRIDYQFETRHPFYIDLVNVNVEYYHDNCRKLAERKKTLAKTIDQTKEKLELLQAEVLDIEFAIFKLRNDDGGEI